MPGMARHLITTADERTWKFDRPVLFLGDWCRHYSRRSVWEKLDAVVLPFHWRDLDKFHKDYLYLSGFYERQLMMLAAKLNQIHRVDKDLRYWRILLGPWLAYFIQMLFDRWSSVQLAVGSFDISGTTVMAGMEDSMVPNDMESFCRLFIGDEWNHYIFSNILERHANISFGKMDFDRLSRSADKSRSEGLKKRLFAKYLQWTSHLVAADDAFFLSTYLPNAEMLKLQLRLGQFPQMWQPVPPACTPIDWTQRSWSVEPGRNEFELFVQSMIPKQIPALYLEGYRQLSEQVAVLPWPSRPQLIFTSNALWYDTVSMAYTAEKVSQGTPLVYGQHGGAYGAIKCSWPEEHEVAISDRYLTWGWTDESRPQVEAVGMLKMPKIRRDVAASPQRLLLVTLECPKYSWGITSELLVMSDEYIAKCLHFSAELPDKVRDALLVRLTSHDFGWGQAAQWKERFPDVECDLGSQLMQNLLHEARLAVYTYNSTGYLEAFASNIPSVLFWDPKVSTLRDSAVPYFERLKQVGILHETPESAAAHVSAVWDDVEAWWLSPAVQDALEDFKARYCHVPTNLLGRIERALRKSMAVSQGCITQ